MSAPEPHGVITHGPDDARRTDYLYRISIKCFIMDEHGKVLIVKEGGRTWWDLPGGGMDHGENMRSVIAREMEEEVTMAGDFTYKIIAVDEPAYVPAHNFWLVRLIFHVKPSNLTFSAGEDGDEIALLDPKSFENSESEVERRIYKYSQLV